LVYRLIEGGHSVRLIGRKERPEHEAGEYRVCDITNYAELREQVRGMDRIIHLAAIPGPGSVPSQQLFHINCQGTYNIYQAAVEEGIDHVCCASSINYLGFTFGHKPMQIRYFPIDEDHPGYSTDPYSFSKQTMEEIGAYFWRREGLSSLLVRIPGVYPEGGERQNELARESLTARGRIAEILEIPEPRRQDAARQMIDEFLRVRFDFYRDFKFREKHNEYYAIVKSRDYSPLSAAYGFTDFWTSIADTDAARAMELAITVPYTGCHPLFVNDTLNGLGLESETLAKLFFPDAHMRGRRMVGNESLVCADRARHLLGFEPQVHLCHVADALQ
jgi:nucleoside-diphosphate-sugar epimerase